MHTKQEEKEESVKGFQYKCPITSELIFREEQKPLLI